MATPKASTAAGVARPLLRACVLQKARPAVVAMGGAFSGAAVPSQRRDTRVVKDLSPDAIAQEIVEWIRQ